MSEDVKEISEDQKRVGLAVKTITEDVKEISEDQKRVGFAVKTITDALPPNFEIIVPSEDCKTDKSNKYRALMRALRLPEDNDVHSLSDSIESLPDANDFSFNWHGQLEKASYGPFIIFLKEKFRFNAVDVSEGQGLPDRLLYITDIYTLRPNLSTLTSDLRKAVLEPRFKFRIRGRTDIAVYKPESVISHGDLEILFEIKRPFTTPTEINRGLREGVLQLIGCNADNNYASPLVIVTGLCKTHYLLYLERCENPEIELRYYLRVKVCASLVKLIQCAQVVLKRGCVTTHFASPPTPTGSPLHGSPVKADEEEEDNDEEVETNVTIESFDNEDDVNTRCDNRVSGQATS